MIVGFGRRFGGLLAGAVILATAAGAPAATASPFVTGAAPVVTPAPPVTGAAPVVTPASPVASGASAVAARRFRAAVIPGEVLVRFDEAASREPAVLSRVSATVGATVIGRPLRGVTRLAVPRGQELSVARRLQAAPAVAYAEPNYRREAFAEEGWGVRAVKADQVWDSTPARQGVTGAGVRVAVLDSGVQRDQGQLAPRVTPGKVFGRYGDDTDNCGHGTAVAGVVAAARNDGVPVAGVAPQATIVRGKVLESDPRFEGCGGSDTTIAAGIRWAAGRAEADIINMSLGGPGYSATLCDAVAAAARSGVLVVVASGNAGDRAPNYPAACPGAVSVGALRRSSSGLRPAEFSSFGKVDIAAPGKAIPVLGARSVSPAIYSDCPDPGFRRCLTGTSFSAPHVAGLAALLFEQHAGQLRAAPPAGRLRMLRQWLLGTAREVSGTGAGVDLRTGHGLPTAPAAAAASVDPDRLLATWRTSTRVIAPTRDLLSERTSAPLAAVLTDGTGRPVEGARVVFESPARGSATPSAADTGGRGEARTALRSTRGGSIVAVTMGYLDDGTTRRLPLHLYVLARDDNVRGVAGRPSQYADEVDPVLDVDDVLRFRLRDGETLRARVRGVSAVSEYVELFGFGPSTTDVTDFSQPILREDTLEADYNPRSFVFTARSTAVRYLDIFGDGSYRLTRSIESPGAIAAFSANPARFTPNGDGRADTTRIAWRLAARGRVRLVIREYGGNAVRSVDFGGEPVGAESFRWNGRGDAGRARPAGRYTAVLSWSDGNGRVANRKTQIGLRR
ncbi:hypothetical protein BH24ACT14_BH24ACT14_23530 [soil metagenome]